jgi:hypothetical protein
VVGGALGGDDAGNERQQEYEVLHGPMVAGGTRGGKRGGSG